MLISCIRTSTVVVSESLFSDGWLNTYDCCVFGVVSPVCNSALCRLFKRRPNTTGQIMLTKCQSSHTHACIFPDRCCALLISVCDVVYSMYMKVFWVVVCACDSIKHLCRIQQWVSERASESERVSSFLKAVQHKQAHSVTFKSFNAMSLLSRVFVDCWVFDSSWH